MKAKITFECTDVDSDEDEIVVQLNQDGMLRDFITFLEEAVKVNIQTDEDGNYLLTSDNISLDLSILHSLVEMITSKMISQGVLYDKWMKPIPKPKGGDVHKLQRPSSTQELTGHDEMSTMERIKEFELKNKIQELEAEIEELLKPTYKNLSEEEQEELTEKTTELKYTMRKLDKLKELYEGIIQEETDSESNMS
jgi:hypothetical protein